MDLFFFGVWLASHDVDVFKQLMGVPSMMASQPAYQYLARTDDAAQEQRPRLTRRDAGPSLMCHPDPRLQLSVATNKVDSSARSSGLVFWGRSLWSVRITRC